MLLYLDTDKPLMDYLNGLLSDGTKFTDAEIADMKQLGSENIHERPDYLDQAEFWSHAGTQGVRGQGPECQEPGPGP